MALSKTNVPTRVDLEVYKEWKNLAWELESMTISGRIRHLIMSDHQALKAKKAASESEKSQAVVQAS